MGDSSSGRFLRPTAYQRRPGEKVSTLGWEVEDLRAAIQELTARGVCFERFDGLPQDELGIWTAPGGSRIAWFRDPDGNTLSLTEFR